MRWPQAEDGGGTGYGEAGGSGKLSNRKLVGKKSFIHTSRKQLRILESALSAVAAIWWRKRAECRNFVMVKY